MNSPGKILVVDDVPQNVKLLADMLMVVGYNVVTASSGQEALDKTASESPDLILLDIMMPGMDGYEVCRQLKADINTGKIPVLFVTALGEVEDEALGFEVGCEDYITKPINPTLVEARVKTHLALYDQRLGLEIQVRERTRELESTRLDIIRRLGRAAEYKDNETGMHVIRMSKVCQLLALRAGMNEAEAELLLNAAPMHDVGKIGIPDNILLKPGKLDAGEWALMQRHVEFGVDIIGEHPSALLTMARTVALTHHEKWDGSGYPNGLAGKAIPLTGRIAAIADVFDALTSKRPYKEPWPIEKALNLFEEQRGKHFDPELLDHFLDIVPQVTDVASQFSD